MAIVLLDFVENALRVAKQALGKHSGKLRTIKVL